MAEYRENKYYNKSHEISTEEWESCKQYFNYECAYCGLHIDEHFVKYGDEYKLYDFHQEHVDHIGSNDLSNCIPSCKSCNSKKWQYEFIKWYNPSNEVFTEERLNKISKWLSADYKNCLK
ncbi:HNH endonuclease [Halalkalibacter oceani]|uniref:HNH endonuclease n=1 Tax=Halalkalibacter oceani TaxID=1653776 RepID=UPI003399F84F